jgi:predicted RNA binding protein YcfA (HicA-like mRNA interferase family)
MPKLPRVSGVEAIRALTRLGFERIRQRGSHVILRRTRADEVKGCVVPMHPELAAGTPARHIEAGRGIDRRVHGPSVK